MNPKNLYIHTVAIAALLPMGGLQAATMFLETGGVAAGDAADFTTRSTGAANSWKTSTEVTPTGTFTNSRTGTFMHVPESSGNSSPIVPPYIRFSISITTVGTYQLYTRWEGNATTSGTAGSSDSIFASIVELRDGAGGNPDWYEQNQLPNGDFNQLPWDGTGEADVNIAGPADNPVVWNITTPGTYTLEYNAREDGAAIDAWVFQLSSLDAPTGLGPASTAVPEPSSAMLFGAAGALLLARRKRQAA